MEDAVLLAESVDPYRTEEAAHLKYQRINRRQGRMSGQIRIRVRYRECTAPIHANSRRSAAIAKYTRGPARMIPLMAPSDEAELNRACRCALSLDVPSAMRYPRAVQALMDLFQYYAKGDLAAASFDALARIAHPASAPLFTAALTGKTSGLKGTAIEGLARLGDQSNLAAIQTALGGERSEGVLLAGNFAAVLLSQASIDPLTDALPRPKFRDQVWQYLVEVASGHTSAFSRQAQDPDARLRADVADILGLSGDPAALAIVEPMVKDRDPQVALAAARAVARLR